MAVVVDRNEVKVKHYKNVVNIHIYLMTFQQLEQAIRKRVRCKLH